MAAKVKRSKEEVIGEMKMRRMRQGTQQRKMNKKEEARTVPEEELLKEKVRRGMMLKKRRTGILKSRMNTKDDERQIASKMCILCRIVLQCIQIFQQIQTIGVAVLMAHFILNGIKTTALLQISPS